MYVSIGRLCMHDTTYIYHLKKVLGLMLNNFWLVLLNNLFWDYNFFQIGKQQVIVKEKILLSSLSLHKAVAFHVFIFSHRYMQSEHRVQKIIHL